MPIPEYWQLDRLELHQSKRATWNWVYQNTTRLSNRPDSPNWFFLPLGRDWHGFCISHDEDFWHPSLEKIKAKRLKGTVMIGLPCVLLISQIWLPWNLPCTIAKNVSEADFLNSPSRKFYSHFTDFSKFQVAPWGALKKSASKTISVKVQKSSPQIFSFLGWAEVRLLFYTQKTNRDRLP